MSEAAFFRLQNAIVKGVDFQDGIRSALMFEPESPETFSTFSRGLFTGKIDPNDLLIQSAILGVEVNNIYVRYAGLALRYGANPNTYLNSKFNFDGDIVDVPIHLGKKIWDTVPRTMQESIQLDFNAFGDVDEEISNAQLEARLQEQQRAGLDVLCMMAIKGFVSDAKITTATLLTKIGINATSFANRHPEFFTSVYGEMKTDSDLGSIFANEVKYFEQWRESLQNSYGSNPDRDARILKYSFFLDLTDILTLSDVYGSMENLRLMFFFQDRESISLILPRLRQLKVIGVAREDYVEDEYGNLVTDDITSQMRETELILLDWCISYYNLDAMKLLLDLNVFPDYTLRSRTIRASKTVCSRYLVQCQALNTMVVEYVKRGYGLDSAQIAELNFSPLTQEAVKKEYSVPAWKYMCKIRTGTVNPDMKEMARQAGIQVGSNKDQICTLFENMSRSDPSTLKQASYSVNRKRISLAALSAADVATGRKIMNAKRVLPSAKSLDEIQQDAVPENPSQLKPAGFTKPPPICANDDTLFRPIEDYPNIDRVTYSDGKNTWCFTSDNFEELLETGINRWATNARGEAGDTIPAEVLLEMRQKLDIIEAEGLEQEPGSISGGIDAVFNANPAMSELFYERESDRHLEEFYRFVEEYGIDSSQFSSLTSADYQLLADTILSPATSITVNRSSPTLALRDFANAALLESRNFKSRDQIGSTLASMLV